MPSPYPLAPRASHLALVVALAGCASAGPGTPDSARASSSGPTDVTPATRGEAPAVDAADVPARPLTDDERTTLCATLRLASGTRSAAAEVEERARRERCAVGFREALVVAPRFAACIASLEADHRAWRTDGILRSPACRAALRLAKEDSDPCTLELGDLFACGTTMYCRDPLPNTGRCEAIAPLGQPCMSSLDLQCGQAAECRQDRGGGYACRPRLRLGEACSDEKGGLGECQLGLFCVGDHCRATPGRKGERAGPFDGCAPGLKTGEDNRCAPANAAGAACQVDGECLSRVCVGDRCL